MLNKDQYNQDEYNDYYARATEGAEIKHGRGGEGNGKKILFALLLLLFIGALGYFVMQMLGGSDDKPESFQKVEATPKQIEIKEEPATTATASTTKTPSSDEALAQKVTETVIAEKAANGDAMDQEEITKLVQAVMANMKNKQASGENSAPIATAQDAQLMDTLSAEETSLLSGPDTVAPTLTESDSKKEASAGGEELDVYNKVVLNEAATSNDDLSQMADALSNVMEEETNDQSNYTQNITKEISSRESEMRIWTVKKGDTLGKIAKKVYGNVMDYKKIYKANPDILRRPDRIYIGQKIRIPAE